jgi:hypothetical protein
MKISHLCVVAPCALAAAAYAGPDWVEVGDAGSTLATAQAVTGIGTPTHILGTLSSGLQGGDYEDMYLIRIETPTSFKFDLTSCPFDSMLYLFNITQAQEALGLLANNDTPLGFGSLIDGPATDLTGSMVVNPGEYALAITGYDRYPVSRTGAIFYFANHTEISGPDGPGGLNPLEGWEGVGDVGSYDVELTGIGYVAAPAPSSCVALGMLALGSWRRRRR